VKKWILVVIVDDNSPFFLINLYCILTPVDIAIFLDYEEAVVYVSYLNKQLIAIAKKVINKT